MKNWKLQLSLYGLALCLMFTAFNVTAHAAIKPEDGAKTPPPVMQFSIMGFFNPEHEYLLDGFNKLSQKSSGVVTITGTTMAYENVDSIGLTLYLQKWDGTAWRNVDSGLTYSTTNDDVYTNGTTYTVPTGYYYRLRTVHWVNNDGGYEQGERVSDYILID
ncbi:DUF6147 family protein [Paenibacillus macerans]|uniref:DUF6147 family protein n=1 Tax=Paenibacillus macerans TaxID=44252 RepID=UPI003D31C5C5